MDYKLKYLKYKQKYLDLKNSLNLKNKFKGGDIPGVYIGVSGPSGVGKTTLMNALINHPEFKGVFEKVLSNTSRLPRKGECQHADYIFDSRENMEKLIADGKYLEHAHIAGNLYGTSAETLEKMSAQNKIGIFDKDTAGIIAMNKIINMPIRILILPGPPEQPAEVYLAELEKRLRSRGETEEIITKRIKTSTTEIPLALSQAPGFWTHVIYNVDKDEAIRQFITAILSHPEIISVIEANIAAKGK